MAKKKRKPTFSAARVDNILQDVWNGAAKLSKLLAEKTPTPEAHEAIERGLIVIQDRLKTVTKLLKSYRE